MRKKDCGRKNTHHSPSQIINGRHLASIHSLELWVLAGWYYSLWPLFKRNVSDDGSAVLFGTTM